MPFLPCVDHVQVVYNDGDVTLDLLGTRFDDPNFRAFLRLRRVEGYHDEIECDFMSPKDLRSNTFGDTWKWVYSPRGVQQMLGDWPQNPQVQHFLHVERALSRESPT